MKVTTVTFRIENLLQDQIEMIMSYIDENATGGAGASYKKGLDDDSGKGFSYWIEVTCNDRGLIGFDYMYKWTSGLMAAIKNAKESDS